jgi:hypothetical protein
MMFGVAYLDIDYSNYKNSFVNKVKNCNNGEDNQFHNKAIPYHQ